MILEYIRSSILLTNYDPVRHAGSQGIRLTRQDLQPYFSASSLRIIDREIKEDGSFTFFSIMEHLYGNC